MSEGEHHWQDLAKRLGIERDQRDLRRKRAIRDLDWSEWTAEEREVYASAFLFPAPAEELIDGVTINGESLKLARLSRTARVMDETGAVWLVIERGRPMKL